MRIRTDSDLGAFIRERRTQLGMDQITLAKKTGTSRKWLVEVEQGAIALEKELESEGLSHVIIGRLAAKVKARAIACHRLVS
jgi:transcriptional regulator with XRE-family HTH domain